MGRDRDGLARRARRLIDEGRAETNGGDPRRGVELLRAAVEDLATLHGEDSHEVLDAQGLLGRALTHARRYSEARTLLEDVLAERARRLGPDHPLTLVVRGNLCRLAHLSGRPEEALLVGELLLADRRRVLGEDHPATLDSIGHVAHALGALGRPAEAAEWFEHQHGRRVVVLGEDHPDTQQARHNALTMRGRAAAAEGSALPDLAAHEQMVAELVRDHGEDSPQAMVARGLLVEQLLGVGEHERAVEVLAALVDDRTRVLGPTAPETLGSRRALLRARAERLGEVVPLDECDAFLHDLLARYRAPHVDRAAGLLAVAAVLDEHFADLELRGERLADERRQLATRLLDLLGRALLDARAVLDATHPLRETAEVYLGAAVEAVGAEVGVRDVEDALARTTTR